MDEVHASRYLEEGLVPPYEVRDHLLHPSLPTEVTRSASLKCRAETSWTSLVREKKQVIQKERSSDWLPPTGGRTEKCHVV